MSYCTIYDNTHGGKTVAGKKESGNLTRKNLEKGREVDVRSLNMRNCTSQIRANTHEGEIKESEGKKGMNLIAN